MEMPPRSRKLSVITNMDARSASGRGGRSPLGGDIVKQRRQRNWMLITLFALCLMIAREVQFNSINDYDPWKGYDEEAKTKLQSQTPPQTNKVYNPGDDNESTQSPTSSTTSSTSSSNGDGSSTSAPSSNSTSKGEGDGDGKADDSEATSNGAGDGEGKGDDSEATSAPTSNASSNSTSASTSNASSNTTLQGGGDGSESTSAPTSGEGDNDDDDDDDNDDDDTEAAERKLTFSNLTLEDLYDNNYFYRAWNISKANAAAAQQEEPLVPMEIMTRYISQHSQEQLETEWKEACGTSSDPSSCTLDATKSNRRFLVATYSCPIETGNRIHRFMNGLLWAVLTNRTFLWRYHTYDVCEEYGEEKCEMQYNTSLITGPDDCKGLIERSPWIPSYDEWKGKLGFASDNSDLVKAEVVDARREINVIRDNATLPYDGVNKATKIDNDAIRLIRTGKQVNQDPGNILRTKFQKGKTPHLSKPQNKERLKALRSKGYAFLYGMFFESLFTMDPSLEPPQTDFPETNPETTKTLFLHSRHVGNFPLTYTYPEQLCLNEYESLLPDKETPCHVFVMSDRPKAVTLLHRKIKNATHCTSSSRTQTLSEEAKNFKPLTERQMKQQAKQGNNRDVGDTYSPSFRAEHGPRAGRGFWEDVALATYARHGMIAFHMNNRAMIRTSTGLIREIVEFRRVLEHQYKDAFEIHSSSDALLPEFFECKNPLIDKHKRAKINTE